MAMAPIVNISASSAPVKAMGEEGEVGAVDRAVEGDGEEGEEPVTVVPVVETVVGVTVVGWVQGP
jgi:hypothetical protein